MKKQIIVLAGSIIAFFSLGINAAGKVYKWVDEKGNVHFSEKAPESDAKQQVEVSEIKKEKIAPIQKRGNGYYCGDMHVLSVYRTSLSAEVLKKAPKAIKRYKKNLRNEEKRFVKRGKNLHRKYANYENHNDSQQRSKEKIGQYKCAINWLQSELDGASGNKRQLILDVERRLQKVEDFVRRKCGSEPAKGTLPAEQKIHRNWTRCKSKNSGRRKELEKELETLRYNL